jgi:hypothetical protein
MPSSYYRHATKSGHIAIGGIEELHDPLSPEIVVRMRTANCQLTELVGCTRCLMYNVCSRHVCILLGGCDVCAKTASQCVCD